MNQEDWEDLLHDLTNNTLDVDDKRDQRYKLAAHMAKLEVDLENLKRRVTSLEKSEEDDILDFDAYELQP